MTTQETIDRAAKIIAGLQWPTPHSSAHIAQALADAGLLATDPGDAALIELAESLTHQACPKGVHPDWFINSEYNFRCPWCVLKEARAAIQRLKRRAQLAEAALQKQLAHPHGAHHDGRLCPCGSIVCESCCDDYPCPTIRALDQEATE